MRFLALPIVLLVSLASAGEPTTADHLPFRSLHSKEELRRDFERRRIHPFGERWMSFDVVVPKSWEGRPVAISREQILEDEQRPVPLARIGPPENPGVFVEVQYLRVEPETPPRRVIEQIAERSGAEIVVGQRGDFSGRAVDDALLRIEDRDGQARFLRATASRHGDVVFLVLGSAPLTDYDDVKRTLGTAAVGFLIGKGGIPRDHERGRLEF